MKKLFFFWRNEFSWWQRGLILLALLAQTIILVLGPIFRIYNQVIQICGKSENLCQRFGLSPEIEILRVGILEILVIPLFFLLYFFLLRVIKKRRAPFQMGIGIGGILGLIIWFLLFLKVLFLAKALLISMVVISVFGITFAYFNKIRDGLYVGLGGVLMLTCCLCLWQGLLGLILFPFILLTVWAVLLIAFILKEAFK